MPKGSESSEQETSLSYDADFSVTAHQVGNHLPDLQELPVWMQEAFQLEAVRPYPDARDGALQLVTQYGRPKAAPGDWIVRLPSGRLTIWPDSEFRQDFIGEGE